MYQVEKIFLVFPSTLYHNNGIFTVWSPLVLLPAAERVLLKERKGDALLNCLVMRATTTNQQKKERERAQEGLLPVKSGGGGGGGGACVLLMLRGDDSIC